MIILETMSEDKVTVTKNGIQHPAVPQCSHTQNLGFLPQII